jgi:hypothetical protein
MHIEKRVEKSCVINKFVLKSMLFSGLIEGELYKNEKNKNYL